MHGVAVDVRDKTCPINPAELRTALSDATAVLCFLNDRIDEAVLTAAPGLRIIANVAAGYDNIDLLAARAAGVMVTNTPDVLTEATADLTFALILACARRIPEADAFMRSGSYAHWSFHDERMGLAVAGTTLGIVGLGRIGKAVARRGAAGFGMRVLYHGRKRLEAVEEQRLGVEYRCLDDLLAESDFISLHAPLTPQTHHLIDTAALARMKPTAVLINTARGALVDEEALAAALAEGAICGAGLDVYEFEPRLNETLARQRERVVMLPHVGSATAVTRRCMADAAVGNVLEFLKGRLPRNVVHAS